MGIGNFIKKLIETNAIWGVRAKQLAGINDAGNVITTSIVVSTTDNSIDFAPLPVPSFFKVGQYIRIFGGPNDSKLLRISNILEGTKLIVEEPVIADSGTRRVTARLWEIHDDPSISRPSSTGSTMFNVHNRQPTNVPEDASALAFTFAEHYHDEEGPEDDFGYLVEDQYVPYGKLVITNFKGIKGQWSYYNNKYITCIATDTWIQLPTEKIVDDKIAEIFKEFSDQYIPYGKLVASSFKGIKGQWSYNDKRYYKCIATDTWFIAVSEELVDDKIANIFTNFADQYVPCCLVPNNSANGLKGQWSFQVGHSSHKGYVKICIATNTWVRFEVDTLF